MQGKSKYNKEEDSDQEGKKKRYKSEVEKLLGSESHYSKKSGTFITKIEKSLEAIMEKEGFQMDQEKMNFLRQKAGYMCQDNKFSFYQYKQKKLFSNEFNLDPVEEKRKRQQMAREIKYKLN
jgi:hypothetical protein